MLYAETDLMQEKGSVTFTPSSAELSLWQLFTNPKEQYMIKLML
jgi:hypothetical protein